MQTGMQERLRTGFVSVELSHINLPSKLKDPKGLLYLETDLHLKNGLLVLKGKKVSHFDFIDLFEISDFKTLNATPNENIFIQV